MDTGGDDRAVDIGDNIERRCILRRYDLGDVFKAVRFVAGIDPLGRIADGEIAAAGEPGFPFQYRQADLLDSTRIDRQFIDDDIAALQHAADSLRRAQHCAQVRPARAVDRRRHGHDIEVRVGET